MFKLISILILASTLSAQNSFALGSPKPPADLSQFTGIYDINLPPSEPEIPHRIQIAADVKGNAQIRLETHSSILTTRDFTIQDRKTMNCFADSDFTASCKAKYVSDILNVRAYWHCGKDHFCLLPRLVVLPKHYDFKLSADGKHLTYSQSGVVSEFTRIR